MSLPNVDNHDIDDFSEQLETRLVIATPREIVRGVVNACQKVEEEAERSGLHLCLINNATQTACSGARELAKRVTKADAEANAAAALREMADKLAEVLDTEATGVDILDALASVGATLVPSTQAAGVYMDVVRGVG